MGYRGRADRGPGAPLQKYKARLVSLTILGLPKRGRTIMTNCDASEYNVVVILIQKQNEEKLKEWTKIGYLSKALNEAQRNYSATERARCEVVCEGRGSGRVIHLWTYLWGSHFTVRAYHVALRWMMAMIDQTGQLMRWRMRLMEFEYQTVHRQGSFPKRSRDCPFKIQ